MQLTRLFKFLQPAAPVGARPATTKPLTADELRAVSGGSPKGGWNVPPADGVAAAAAGRSDSSPKGGW